MFNVPENVIIYYLKEYRCSVSGGIDGWNGRPFNFFLLFIAAAVCLFSLRRDQ